MGLSSSELAELLRKQEQADPTLRDIYSYIDNMGSGAVNQGPNEHDGNEAGWGSTGLGMEFADTQANNGADGNAPQAPVVFKPPELFAPGITLGQNNQNEGSSNYHYNVDPSKFPQTRYGDVTSTAPVEWNTELYNPNNRYDDDNYGNITRASNVNTQSWSDMVFPAIMAAFGGIVGMPAIATQLVQLAAQFGNGGGLNWGSLASILAGQAGINLPPGTSTAINTIINQLQNNGGKKP